MKQTLLIILMVLFMPVPSYATETCDAINAKEVWVTCYTATGNPCANGKYPEEGVVAYMPELIDDNVVLMWESVDGKPGRFIGKYDIWDTGNSNIKKGYVIDVYRDSLERCYEFAKEYTPKVLIEVLSKEEYNARQRLRKEQEIRDSSARRLRISDIP